MIFIKSSFLTFPLQIRYVGLHKNTYRCKYTNLHKYINTSAFIMVRPTLHNIIIGCCCVLKVSDSSSRKHLKSIGNSRCTLRKRNYFDYNRNDKTITVYYLSQFKNKLNYKTSDIDVIHCSSFITSKQSCYTYIT